MITTPESRALNLKQKPCTQHYTGPSFTNFPIKMHVIVKGGRGIRWSKILKSLQKKNFQGPRQQLF